MGRAPGLAAHIWVTAAIQKNEKSAEDVDCKDSLN